MEAAQSQWPRQLIPSQYSEIRSQYAIFYYALCLLLSVKHRKHTSVEPTSTLAWTQKTQSVHTQKHTSVKPSSTLAWTQKDTQSVQFTHDA